MSWKQILLNILLTSQDEKISFKDTEKCSLFTLFLLNWILLQSWREEEERKPISRRSWFRNHHWVRGTDKTSGFNPHGPQNSANFYRKNGKKNSQSSLKNLFFMYICFISCIFYKRHMCHCNLWTGKRMKFMFKYNTLEKASLIRAQAMMMKR